MRKWFLLFSFVVILCTSSLVNACTCALSPGSCNPSWRNGDEIFVGTVTKTFSVTAPATFEDSLTQNGFQFSVSESFRGSAIAGQDITIYTGMGGGDCGYQFNVGTSYLVYAFLANSKLVTGICSPTSPAARMRHVIRQLRALRKGESVAALFGMITTSPIAFTEDKLDLKPLAGKRVRVIGGRTSEQSTTTDDEGVYSFQSLPVDTYRIEVDPPAGMSTWQLNSGESYTVEIGAQGVSGCPASISFSADGRIKGKVVDENGNGVAGFVITEFVDPREAEISRLRGGGMGYTTENGEFELSLLRPGRYRLVFRPKIGDKVSFRIPPVKSEIITVALGQRIEDFRLKVPVVRR